MGTIVISSPHGLRASAIGRALSDVLDVPVLDRAIPARVARDLAVPMAEALAHDEHLAGGLGGLFVRYAVPLVAAGGLGTPWPTIGEDEFRDPTGSGGCPQSGRSPACAFDSQSTPTSSLQSVCTRWSASDDQSLTSESAIEAVLRETAGAAIDSEGRLMRMPLGKGYTPPCPSGSWV
jgi:hypothetical protein